MLLIKLFIELSKLRLTTSVVFSSLAGFLIATTQFNSIDFFFLITGGFFVVTASNIINQIIEKNLDGLMDRTKKRPLPEKRISNKTAFLFAFGSIIAGTYFLYKLNTQSAMFGLLAVFLYTVVYTPLKKRTPFAVFVGAIPGAIPFMLGWVAATNDFNVEPGFLFATQFVWQLPHFWSIAWVLDEDYKKAGFVLLPSKKRDKKSSFQIVFFSFLLIPITLLPFLGLTGNLVVSPYLIAPTLLLGLLFLYKSTRLHIKQTQKEAKELMFFGLLYLPLLQIILIINKFI